MTDYAEIRAQLRLPLYESLQPCIIPDMQNRLYSLDHYEFIRISGADSISFLQGQLSCNTELLSENRSLVGALCNLKGRVIADFRLLQHGEQILMQCAEGMAAKVLTTLSKYAVFSKVELTQLESQSAATPRVLGLLGGVNEALSILGLELPGSDNGVSSSADCSMVRISGDAERIEIWMHSEAAAHQFLGAMQSEQPSTDLDAWHSADIEAGIVHVTPALSEEFTPQLLNYDLSGLIDFKKGCYTGQEIVARMFYRGTAKRRLQAASSSHAVSNSSKIVAKGNEDLGGDILAFSNTGAAEPLLLAILPVDIADSAESLTLSDNAESEVRIRELPYSAG